MITYKPMFVLITVGNLYYDGVLRVFDSHATALRAGRALGGEWFEIERI